MSTKKKAPPRKKTSKQRTSKHSTLTPVDVAQAPLKLEREDQLTLQLALSERTNKRLQLQSISREMEDADTNWNKQLQAINVKYDLNPEADKIDLGTGVIQKG